MPQIMVERLLLDDAANVRETKDGYITATPRVARTGIQVYTGKEVGKPNLQTVRVYRPESEVMAQDAFMSLAHRAITDDHPPEMVNAANWRKHSIGISDGEVVRDGEFIRVPLALMDATAVKKYKAGKAELSVGYTCDLKFVDGVEESTGLAYDAIQTNIRANHIALVDRARGGHKLRIGDDGSLVSDVEDDSAATTNDEGDSAMADAVKKTILVDGIQCAMDEKDAQIVQRALDSATNALSKANEVIAKLTADAKKKDEDEEEEKKKKEELFKAKDAEIVALKKQVEDAKLTPEKIAAMVKDRADVIGKSKIVLGDKAPKDIETLDTDVVRKAVVDAKLGDAAKGWGAKEIEVAFTSLTSDIKAGDAAAAAGSAAALAAQFGGKQMHDASKGEPAGYAAYKKRLQDGYKTQPAV